jgi:hypothetical protein
VKFVRISLTVAAVLVAAVVGILALSGGLRLTSPVGEMRAEALGLELTGAEEMTSLEEVEDRVCFLQCSARMSGCKLDSGRSHNQKLRVLPVRPCHRGGGGRTCDSPAHIMTSAGSTVPGQVGPVIHGGSAASITTTHSAVRAIRPG